MVKIQDIARQMGLSTSTVYKAFNGGADINKNTRAEILKVAARMGYIGKPKNFPHKRVCVFLERMSSSKSPIICMRSHWPSNVPPHSTASKW